MASNSSLNLNLLGRSASAASSNNGGTGTASLQLDQLLAVSGNGQASAPAAPALAVPTLPALAVPALPALSAPALPTLAVPTLPAAPELPALAVPSLPTDALALPTLGLPELPALPGSSAPGAGQVGLFDPLVPLAANTQTLVDFLNGAAELLHLSPVTPTTNGPTQPLEVLVNTGLLAPVDAAAGTLLDPLLGTGAVHNIVVPVQAQVSNLFNSVDALLANAPLSPSMLPLDNLPVSASHGNGSGTLEVGSLTATGALHGINSTAGLLSLLPALPVASLV